MQMKIMKDNNNMNNLGEEGDGAREECYDDALDCLNVFEHELRLLYRLNKLDTMRRFRGFVVDKPDHFNWGNIYDNTGRASLLLHFWAVMVTTKHIATTRLRRMRSSSSRFASLRRATACTVIT